MALSDNLASSQLLIGAVKRGDCVNERHCWERRDCQVCAVHDRRKDVAHVDVGGVADEWDVVVYDVRHANVRHVAIAARRPVPYWRRSWALMWKCWLFPCHNYQ